MSKIALLAAALALNAGVAMARSSWQSQVGVAAPVVGNQTAEILNCAKVEEVVQRGRLQRVTCRASPDGDDLFAFCLNQKGQAVPCVK